MIKHLFIIIAITFTTATQAQETKKAIALKGVVLNALDSLPLTNVNVVDKNTHYGTFTNREGVFVINVNMGDSVKVSSLEYGNYSFVATENNTAPVIYLSIESHELDGVTIRSFDKRKFKDDFLHNVPEDSMPINLNLPKYKPFDIAKTKGPTKFKVTMVLGWDAAGMKIRQGAQQIDEWKTKMATVDNFHQRYNAAFIKKMTGLSDKDIEPFMKFCNLSPSAAAQKSDYELSELVKQCYVAFQAQPKGQ